MGLIALIIMALLVAGLITRYTRLQAPTQSPCSGDCNQGRNCTCMQTKQTVENWPYPNPEPSWPFPTKKKP
jgi:hypothetical protein